MYNYDNNIRQTSTSASYCVVTTVLWRTDRWMARRTTAKHNASCRRIFGSRSI